MIPVELALSLRAEGLRWTPTRGDRFVLPHRGMDDEVFVLSDMTVEVHDFPAGSVIGFNGVTEWALDSVDQDAALWLPSESQLRQLLGGLFRRLEVDDRDCETDPRTVTVTVRLPEGESRYTSADAEEAYASALLAVLRSVTASSLPG